MKRQIQEHDHMINFIQNISFVLNQNSTESLPNSERKNTCIKKCYETQFDDTKDSNLHYNTKKDKFDMILLRRNQLCKELCSKFTSILESNQFQKNDCSTSIPKISNNSSMDLNNYEPKDSIIPILIRGRRVHSNNVTKERWKQFKDMMKRNNAPIEKYNEMNFPNQTLHESANQNLNATLQPPQRKLPQKRSVISPLCPSFQYEHIFLKGVNNASIARQVEDRNTTLINRTGG